MFGTGAVHVKENLPACSTRSWNCFSSPRAVPCSGLCLGLVLEHMATATAARTLGQLGSASAGVMSGLRQVGLAGNKVSADLVLVLSSQRHTGVLSISRYVNLGF